MSVNTFACPEPKCGYAIDSEGLNSIQLKALRVWKKTCPRCGKMNHFVEQTSLLETNTTKNNGGSPDAIHSQVNTKTQSQKRRSARHDGLH